MHNEAKPIFYFGYLGGSKVLYSVHVGGSNILRNGKVMLYCSSTVTVFIAITH